MNIQTLDLTATNDLAMITWTLHASVGRNDSGGGAHVQIWAEFDDGHFEQASPRDSNGAAIGLNIPDGGITGQLVFSQKMPYVGHIKDAKVVLFDPASNFGVVILDKYPLPLDVTIATLDARIVKPELDIHADQMGDKAGPHTSFALNGNGGTNSFGVQTDKRFLMLPDKSARTSGIWYTTATGAFDITFEIHDGSTHCVGLHMMDTDNQGRAQRIDSLDEAGQVKASTDLAKGTFVNGMWTRINVSGKVHLRVTDTARVNAILDAITFDPPQATAGFVVDGTTMGDWPGVYGTEGYYLVSQSHLPDYLIVTEATADGYLHIPYTIKFPDGFHYQDGGFWAMAQSPDGAIFKQDWVQFETGHAADGTLAYTGNTQVASGPDHYRYIDSVFVLKPPASGVYNIQFGLFGNAWGASGNEFQWVWPGITTEIGGDAWVTKTDPSVYADLYDARFHLGKYDLANHGNATYTLWDRVGNAGWARVPANFDAASIAALRVHVGAKMLRIVFGGDQWLTSTYYKHWMTDAINKVLAGGAIPYIEPQVPPAGGVDGLSNLWKQLVAEYGHLPLCYGICNEPSTYPNWSDWKAVGQRIATEIRAAHTAAGYANPHITLSCEGWAKDATAASNDPLPAGLVDAYALHGYVPGYTVLAAQIGHTIPLIVQEFIDDTEEFFKVANDAPHVIGIMPWTWNTLGDDALPLAQSVSPFAPTPRGQKMLDYIAKAKAGTLGQTAAPSSPTIPTPITPAPVVSPTPTPVPTPSPTPDPGVSVVPTALEQRISALESGFKTLDTSLTALEKLVDGLKPAPAVPVVSPVDTPPSGSTSQPQQGPPTGTDTSGEVTPKPVQTTPQPAPTPAPITLPAVPSTSGTSQGVAQPGQSINVKAGSGQVEGWTSDAGIASGGQATVNWNGVQAHGSGVDVPDALFGTVRLSGAYAIKTAPNAKVHLKVYGIGIWAVAGNQQALSVLANGIHVAINASLPYCTTEVVEGDVVADSTGLVSISTVGAVAGIAASW